MQLSHAGACWGRAWRALVHWVWVTIIAPLSAVHGYGTGLAENHPYNCQHELWWGGRGGTTLGTEQTPSLSRTSTGAQQ